MAVFVLGASFQASLGSDGAGRWNLVYKLLIWVFLIANPVFALVGWASLALPPHVTASPAGRVLVGGAYVVAFLGGWWLVAGVVDRWIARRSGKVE